MKQIEYTNRNGRHFYPYLYLTLNHQSPKVMPHTLHWSMAVLHLCKGIAVEIV